MISERLSEAVARRCSVKRLFLEISQNSQENTCAIVSFLTKLQAACNVNKKETLAQVFSCGFCEISKNSFSYRARPVAASGLLQKKFIFLPDLNYFHYFLLSCIVCDWLKELFENFTWETDDFVLFQRRKCHSQYDTIVCPRKQGSINETSWCSKDWWFWWVVSRSR